MTEVRLLAVPYGRVPPIALRLLELVADHVARER
jgi:hypothetical protein